MEFFSFIFNFIICALAQLLSKTAASIKNFEIDGPCPHIIADPVDFGRHSGEWYEVERSANNFYGSDQCHKELWKKPVNNKSEVIFKSVSTSSGTALTVTADAVKNAQGFSMNFHFPTLGDMTIEYYPIKVDSTEYAIVWGCEPRGNKHIERAWIFSRLPTPPCNIEVLKQEAFSRYNLSIPEMIKHNHSKCGKIFCSFQFENSCQAKL